MIGKVVKLLLGLAVGAVCLWLAFRGVAAADRDNGVGWAEIGAHLRGTAWWGYAGVVALFLVQVALRVQRWRVQVRGLTGKDPPLRDSLAINAAGFAGVFLMPFRLGELVRPNLAAQRGLLPAAQGFAASALERVARLLRGFLDGLACFRRPGHLLAYLGHTVAYWTINAVSMWVLLRGMGIDVGLMAAAFCLCFVVIGVMIPAPPGNVGNFHAFARLALVIEGVPVAPAVAFAIMLHALSVVCVVGLVLVFLATGDLSVSRMRAAAADTGSAPPPTPS